MKTLISLLSFIFILSLFSACVPHRKYQDLQASRNELNEQYSTSQRLLETAQNENKQLLESVRDKNKQIEELERDTTLKGNRYRSIRDLNLELERLYKQILSQNESLINNSSSEKKELTESLSILQSQLNMKEADLLKKEVELQVLRNDLNAKMAGNEKLKTDLDAREDKVKQLETELKTREDNVAQLQNDIKEREKRVNELELAINSRENQMLELKEKLNKALLGFDKSDLSVEERDGNVYISLSQDLLFHTGSKVLDTKGKSAIKSLADVLNKNTDLQINIEGHTDDVGDAENNWDLSVLRATSIVKELTKNNVDPKRITASGKGEHFPVAPNTTTEGKAKNRRTSIILSPNLDELYEIINN